MKKFVVALMALTVALILTVSVALADCSCFVSSAVRMIAFQLGTVELDVDAEDYDVLAAIATGIKLTECDCTTNKMALLRILFRNKTAILETISEEKIDVLMEYIAACNCCKDHEEVKPVPSTPVVDTHTHHGGTHENGGKCTGCGVRYQKHEVTWEFKNNSYHIEKCCCGWTGREESHKSNTVISTELDSNGRTVGKCQCSVCGAYYYKYVNVSVSGNCTCECCYGNCCKNCSCGCACK